MLTIKLIELITINWQKKESKMNEMKDKVIKCLAKITGLDEEELKD